MPAKWFVQKDELVDGPLSTEDVHLRLQGGQLLPTHMIWGRGLEQWFTLRDWSADPTLTSLVNVETAAPEAWHYASEGKSVGPVDRETLINNLKAFESLGSVMLWTKGMKEWTPLFEFHDILSDIGVNKRQFPRADLTGKAVMKGDVDIVAPLVSISEGGFGIQIDKGVVAGQVLTVELHSPAFREVLHAKAEARYAAQGVLGMKFVGLDQGVKGSIIQFVKQSQMRFTIKSAA